MIDDLIREWQETKRRAEETRTCYVALGLAAAAYLESPTDENQARLREVLGPLDWWDPGGVMVSHSKYTAADLEPSPPVGTAEDT
jgi:hypothetical protein